VLKADKARVTGLKGLTYLDKSADPKNPAKKTCAAFVFVFVLIAFDVCFGCPRGRLNASRGAPRAH
jgi:hypothetical protein